MPTWSAPALSAFPSRSAALLLLSEFLTAQSRDEEFTRKAAMCRGAVPGILLFRALITQVSFIFRTKGSGLVRRRDISVGKVLVCKILGERDRGTHSPASLPWESKSMSSKLGEGPCLTIIRSGSTGRYPDISLWLPHEYAQVSELMHKHAQITHTHIQA